MDFENVTVGMVFDTGTKTHKGIPNYAVCEGRHGTPTPGFYAHFVNPDDFKERRRPDDKAFFVHEFEFAKWDYIGMAY